MRNLCGLQCFRSRFIWERGAVRRYRDFFDDGPPGLVRQASEGTCSLEASEGSNGGDSSSSDGRGQIAAYAEEFYADEKDAWAGSAS